MDARAIDPESGQCRQVSSTWQDKTPCSQTATILQQARSSCTERAADMRFAVKNYCYVIL
jgi:hypothetical protein